MADLIDRAREYLSEIHPHWNGRMLDIRARIMSLPVGDSFTIQNRSGQIYQIAREVGAVITTKKLLKGGWEIKKVAQATDSLEDIVFRGLSEIVGDDKEKQEMARVIGFKLTKQIKEYYEDRKN